MSYDSTFPTYLSSFLLFIDERIDCFTMCAALLFEDPLGFRNLVSFSFLFKFCPLLSLLFSLVLELIGEEVVH